MALLARVAQGLQALCLAWSSLVALPLARHSGAGEPGRGPAHAGVEAREEADHVVHFLTEFRAGPGAKAHFEVAYLDGVRSAVATKALKKGAVVARTPAAAVVGPASSKGHERLAGACAAAGEALCTPATFAAAALWLCTGEKQGCRSYARMLPALSQLRNFAGFSEPQRGLTRLLEPALADGWLQSFEQLRALVASVAADLGHLALLPARAPGAADADEQSHHRSLWWALGVASTRAMILPRHMPGLGHLNMALFPALDMFNFHPNASLANVKYRGLDLLATRRIAKGEQLRIAKDAKMTMSPLESLANQGFYLEELQDGPEIKIEPDAVPYDHERSQRFGCLAVPGHFRRPGAAATGVWPAETLACLHVMWYPPDDAASALAAGHLRPSALPTRPPEAAPGQGRRPTAQSLRRWQRLDAEVWKYLGSLCRAGLERARAALASPEAQEVADGERSEGAGSTSATLLKLAREVLDVYERCGDELRVASGQHVTPRQRRRSGGAGEL